MIEQLNDEEATRERHRQRIEEMKRSKQKQMMFRSNLKKYAPPAAGAAAMLVLMLAGMKLYHTFFADNQGNPANSEIVENNEITDNNKEEGDDLTKAGENEEDEPEVAGNGENESEADGQASGRDEEGSENSKILEISSVADMLKEESRTKSYAATITEDTLTIQDSLASGDEFYSKYAILIGLESGNIIAEKDYCARINPASMTKILTVLVAAEHVENLDDTIVITPEITDYGFVHKCSSAGFVKDEVVTVRDLFYGTILPSGADAAVGLAVYVAGDQETFVEMMNEKLKELGLDKTSHFTNCVGVYDEEHYSTVYDMALILEAAVDNELCREFLSAHMYTTKETEQHPEGINLSNLFLRRIEDRDNGGGEVLYAKTGFVEQSGNCAASYAVDKDGKGYICVTVEANSPFRCIYDHSGLYKQFLG